MEKTTLDFVKLACSKDKTQYYLKEVYRDTNKLVATDGHRLHYANGLPDTTPHYLSGLDAEFPKYEQVLPKGTPQGSFALTIRKEDINAIKAMIALGKSQGEKGPITTRLSYDNGFLTFAIKSICFEASFKTPCSVEAGSNFEGRLMSLNLSFFLDAILYGKYVTINYYGPESPLKIDVTTFGTAIIMPMRDIEE